MIVGLLPLLEKLEMVRYLDLFESKAVANEAVKWKGPEPKPR